VEDDRCEHVELQIIPADRRGDRRQGFHRCAPVCRSCGSLSRHSQRRIRVPGTEVLGRKSYLCAGVDLARGAGQDCGNHG
jgi:hypothetical protein